MRNLHFLSRKKKWKERGKKTFIRSFLLKFIFFYLFFYFCLITFIVFIIVVSCDEKPSHKYKTKRGKRLLCSNNKNNRSEEEKKNADNCMHVNCIVWTWISARTNEKRNSFVTPANILESEGIDIWNFCINWRNAQTDKEKPFRITHKATH